MAEPTGVLTLGDLIIEVSEKLGCAYYGSNGTEAAQVPTDAHDLALCTRIVNKAIRMFINDAPQPNGWRWIKPVASLILWPSIDVAAANAISVATTFAGSLTTLTVPTAAFYPSMELKTITITGVGDKSITYLSSTQIRVAGNVAASALNKTWSIKADGNYTMPQDFGGQISGQPTFSAGTNRGSSLSFTDESVIRELRANIDNTGTPYLMSSRIMSTGSPRPRWEAMFYGTPNEVLTVQFPYMLHFTALTTTTEVSPAPFGHDEAIKAACRAVVEKDVEDALGMEWQYYREIALPNSYRVDALSAPKKLGYFGNGAAEAATIQMFRDGFYQRPTVTLS